MSDVGTVTRESTWRIRPPDARLSNLDELHEATKTRADRSSEMLVSNRQIEIVPSSGKKLTRSSSIKVSIPDGRFVPTHWSFSQLCSRSRWRASDMRDLVPTLVKLNIEYGLTFRVPESKLKLYCDSTNKRLLALTSPTYERIYDYQVVDEVRKALARREARALAEGTSLPGGSAVGDGSEFCASDHDLFLFLVLSYGAMEIQRPDGKKEELKRGLLISNSETGRSSLKLKTFLYRWACSNRMIFGVRDVKSLSIVHRRGARKRFEKEVPRWLDRALETPAPEKPLRSALEWSMREKVGKDEEEVQRWLLDRSFTIQRVKEIIQAAKEQEGKAETVWDLVQGGTASVQGKKYTDQRVLLEAEVSRLLERGYRAAA